MFNVKSLEHIIAKAIVWKNNTVGENVFCLITLYLAIHLLANCTEYAFY